MVEISMERDALRQQAKKLVKRMDDLLNQYRDLLIRISASTPRTAPEGVSEPLIGTKQQEEEAGRIRKELNAIDPDYLIRTLLMVPFDPHFFQNPPSPEQRKLLARREHQKTIWVLMLALEKGWLKPLSK